MFIRVIRVIRRFFSSVGDFFTAILGLALLAGCAAPRTQDGVQIGLAPHLATEEAVMDDGYGLPFRRWGNDRYPHALVLALHGFNDYANAFASLGPYLAERGILTYAYDQRGFGEAAQRGVWAGTQRMTSDLQAVAALLRKRHPEVPLYLLGESMGGAVVMASPGAAYLADGAVLIAPAVWSRETMNPLQRIALQVAAHTVPWLELTGEGLDIRPSDNLEMLRALGADPLVVKETRVDALWGITNLMDRATSSAHRLPRPALVLYGEHDEIIPKSAFCAAVQDLPRDAHLRVVLYADGWHMLTRDLQGRQVMEDIAAWILDPGSILPSGEETALDSPRLRRFCPPPDDAAGPVPAPSASARAAPASGAPTNRVPPLPL